ncbi:MAG: cyclopropane-fatty-acyl-phospholipid synthase family protein [Thiobacillaceae bacterium]|nr:cyclopropane-fatty-acyl-phospholipid synthase family protein [Thiobacillaceae bacterium]MCX7673362.1 cyclopropane-fatty-acyl-phospholipid synthase family protein [Thiobacillaceae bacterium]MDW8323537.1 cyclopropane-fatty-acyl-phospholipid synthase family protein [Burkholderiales bacterium]
MAGVRKLLAEAAERTDIPFRVVFPDGSEFRHGRDAPAFSLILRNRRASRRALLYGHTGLIEAYFAGDLTVEGDFALVFRAGMDMDLGKPPSGLTKLRNDWHEWRHSNRSRAQAKANARFHYGLGTEFYRLWLDRDWMMYTCAYWKEGTHTLEQAQLNKIDHVARKLRLAAGERFVDIGCGFGGFMFRAASAYGAQGVGVNTTTEQVVWLREEIARRGLADRLQVIEADFRDIPGQYDKVVSIGVLEHAGRDQLAEVVAAHARALKPGGLGMLHFIGHVGVFDTEYYIREYIFPGGWIPSLAETLQAMEAAGLEILDVENLRRHYALTLDEWARRFEANWPQIQALDRRRFDDRFYRQWRTYLWSCAEMFRSRNSRTHLFQVLFSRGNVGYDHPMSRSYMYA